MNFIKNLSFITLVLILFVNISYSQNVPDRNKRIPQTTKKESVKIIKNSEQVKSENQPDFKIISSTASYIELEYYPVFNPSGKINYNRESFDDISFENYSYAYSFITGSPDIKSRVFPLFLPSMYNNVITIIDYDVNEVRGINLVPVPDYRLIKPPFKSFEDIEMVYSKNSNYYSKNKFYPDNIAELSAPHGLRDNLISNIILNPYQYNPVSGLLKQYTRIRIRVTFGGHPDLITRVRSFPEIELLRGAAINSNIAINWKNPELKKPSGKTGIFNSEMSSGDWYKIEIRDEGLNGSSDAMYKITRSFLQNSGINVEGVDSRNIKIYGNSGMMLPTTPDEPRPQDLVELPVFFPGEDDGKFDEGDYIVFFGRSVNNWVYDSLKHRFTHNLNTYSGSNYYWLCLNTPGHGKRMLQVPSAGNQNLRIPGSFTEKLFYEPEFSNLLNEGNVWFSRRISNNESIVWNNTLTGLESNTNILYRIRPVSRVFQGYTNNMFVKEVNSNVSDYYISHGYS